MRHLIRSLWHEPSPDLPPPRPGRDRALIGALLAAIALEAALHATLPDRLPALLLTIGLLPTLLWRRRRPLLMVAIAFTVTTVAPLFGDGTKAELVTTVYLLALPYCLFRWGSGRDVVLGTPVIGAAVGISYALGEMSLGDTIGCVAVAMAAFALGTALRFRARVRQRELEQVALKQREELARDLHDTVAHHVSAMAIRAQAGLAMAGTRPEAAVDALRVIEAEAGRALTELRSMVRVLRRDEPAGFDPQPQIRDLARLAGRSGTGPVVDVRLAGELGGLPSAVDTAVYRLAQESLTNALRHARHATQVTVSVTADGSTVQLSVSDDGRAAADPAGSGYGLRGMYERARLLGGTCTAGPGPVQGWLVTASLPRNAPAA
ncbi:two-component sensor histidine kinase [Catellatospora sp. TT07R-123]|uniref:sensor histidine kinase n=1 Tax=Catellatospora sp. TT07R-123 TaxID=2733863 RepID=UPI001B08CAAF|nr:sensor histidine kinase [Catellatospora sp. TT07R-123]GHJ47870.1 two-component sensor histidine kinase [Catellatospora sp. TT07R-123]